MSCNELQVSKQCLLFLVDPVDPRFQICTVVLSWLDLTRWNLDDFYMLQPLLWLLLQLDTDGWNQLSLNMPHAVWVNRPLFKCDQENTHETLVKYRNRTFNLFLCYVCIFSFYCFLQQSYNLNVITIIIFTHSVFIFILLIVFCTFQWVQNWLLLFFF